MNELSNAINNIFSDMFQTFSVLLKQYWFLFSIPLFLTILSNIFRNIIKAIKPDVFDIDLSVPIKKEEKASVLKIEYESEVKEIPLNCVNCGAPMNGSCLCEYCGTNYSVDNRVDI